MDGEEALDILKTTRCDVVFTDIRMPIMDGVELMQRVRRQYPEMMLVVLSGYSDFSYVSEAVRSQAVDYLLKPLTEEALSGLLSQLKERYLAREHEQIRRKLAERINKAAPPSGGENAPDERLGAFLLCAGALPICESPEMCPGAEFWSGGALREAAAETINELSTFNWEFMGNTPSEAHCRPPRRPGRTSADRRASAQRGIGALGHARILRLPPGTDLSGGDRPHPQGAAQGTRAAGAHRREPFARIARRAMAAARATRKRSRRRRTA